MASSIKEGNIRKITLQQTLDLGNKVYNMSEEELRPIISQLGSDVKRKLSSLKKSGQIEASPAAQYLIKELNKKGIDDWEKRGALSQKDANINTYKSLYKLYTNFYKAKTSTTRGTKNYVKTVKKKVNYEKISFDDKEQEKQYISNFWYMYHILQEKYSHVFNALQGYSEKVSGAIKHQLLNGNKVYIEENLGKTDDIVFKNSKGEDTSYSMKDLLTSFDSRDKDFDSSKIPEDVMKAFDAWMRTEYKKYF